MPTNSKKLVQKGDEVMRPKTVRLPETREFFVECAKRGLKLRDVAEAIGVGRGGFSVEVTQNFPWFPSRLKVELLFDRPIWSTPKKFRQYKLLRAFCGFDAHLARRKTLLQFARSAGARVVARMNRVELIEAILERAEINSKKK